MLCLLSFFTARGGATTATTYIRPYKQAAGLSAVQTMEELFAYGLNPQKLGAVVDYAKARPVFDGYKAAQYSKK